MSREVPWTIERVVVLGGRVDSQRVVKGRDQVVRMDRRALRIRPIPIRFPINLTATDSSAGQQAGVAFGPMVAAAGPDVVGCLHAEFWRSAKFSDCDYQGPIQESTRMQVFDKA